MVVRSDLEPLGYQLPQAIHSVVSFCYSHKEIAERWHKESDYLVVLNIDNEDKLIELMHKAEELNIKFEAYREEDLDMRYTSATFESGPITKKLLQGLKLAMSNLK